MTADPGVLAFRSLLSNFSATWPDLAPPRTPSSASQGCVGVGDTTSTPQEGLGQCLLLPRESQASCWRGTCRWRMDKSNRAWPHPRPRAVDASAPRPQPMQSPGSRLAISGTAPQRPSGPPLTRALFRAMTCVYETGAHSRSPTWLPRTLRDFRKPRLLPARPRASPGVPGGEGTGVTGSQGATHVCQIRDVAETPVGDTSPRSKVPWGCRPSGARRRLRRRTRSPGRCIPASRVCTARVAAVTDGTRPFQARNESRDTDGAKRGPRSCLAPTVCAPFRSRGDAAPPHVSPPYGLGRFPANATATSHSFRGG